MIRRRLFSSVAAALLLAACGDAARVPLPGEPGADTVCALDGMSIKDYPGPKAQIVFKGGHIDFFCSLDELFEVLFGEDGQHGVAASYVQDMGKADWNRPHGHWIDARSAFYVLDSRVQGAMGPAIASFATMADARAFAAREGGRVLDASQVRPATLRPAPATFSPTNHEEDKHESIH
jgi:copper chaperone NosL